MSGPHAAGRLDHTPREELRALQLKKLQRTLKQVYEKVPFYKEKFDAAGICVTDFGTLDQLPALPFTRKADLWEHYPLRLLAVEPESVVRVHASSGTKGRLTMVGYTQSDLRDWAELCARMPAATVSGDGVEGDFVMLGLHSLVGPWACPISTNKKAPVLGTWARASDGGVGRASEEVLGQ